MNKKIMITSKIALSMILAIILGAVTFSPLALAHRYHTSLTRIDYNANEKLAEITIQIFTNDLEDVLTKRNGGKPTVHLDKTPKVSEMILNYLSDRFVIRNNTGEIKKLRFVGMEPQNDVTLIYLETPMPEGFGDATMENSVLNDQFDDQVNLVTARADNLKTDLVFKTNDAPQSLIKKPE